MKFSQRLHLSFDDGYVHRIIIAVQQRHRPNGTGFESNTHMHICCWQYILFICGFTFVGIYNNEIDKRFRVQIIRKMEFICSAMPMVCSTVHRWLPCFSTFLLSTNKILIAPLCCIQSHRQNLCWIDWMHCSVSYRTVLTYLRKTLSNQAKGRIFNCVWRWHIPIIEMQSINTYIWIFFFAIAGRFRRFVHSRFVWDNIRWFDGAWMIVVIWM